MEYRIEIIPEKKFVGMRTTMSHINNKTGELWRTFMPRRKEISNAVTTDLLSLQIYPPHYFKNFDPKNQFEKWALVEVADFSHLPNDMEPFILKSGQYAVFIHRGSSQDNSTFEYIFTQWLPGSGFLLEDRPHFEILGARYKNNDPNSEEEIWIPVKSKV
jgi:AraC family transcriptional regulator